MYFAKSVFLVAVVLGALDLWIVEGMAYRRIVRPTKTSKQIEQSYLEHEPLPYLQQHPTVKPAHDLSQYQPPIASASENAPVEYNWSGGIVYPTQEPTVVDEYRYTYPDGSYEFRYELTDGTVRYECGYFAWFGQKKILSVKGFYSYRQTDGTFFTVFYRADQNGYQSSSPSISVEKPILPQSLADDLINDNGLRNFKEAPLDSVEKTHDSHE